MFLAAALCAFSQDDLLARAQKALEGKDYAQAVALLRDYTGKHPDDYRALFNLGYASTMLGERRQAAEAYEKTLSLRPDLFEARLNLGALLLEDGRERDALPYLAAASSAKPDHFRASLFYADALARSGDRARAAEQYGKALALNSNSAEAHLGLGRVWAEEKRYEQAEQEIARAMELKPADPAARLELARVYELSGRVDKAAEIYTDYLKQEPSSAPVRRRLGALYLEEKKYAEAIAELEQAARAAPAEEDAWYLARAYSGGRRPDEALPLLERLRQSQPANFDVLLLLGQMLSLKRDFPAAQEALQAAIRLRPGLPDPYVDLANVMYLQNRYPETLAVLDRVARLGPPTPWWHWLRAITLDKLDQVEGALESYHRFLAIDAGKYPDQEFQARQRIKVLNLRLEKGGKRRHK